MPHLGGHFLNTAHRPTAPNSHQTSLCPTPSQAMTVSAHVAGGSLALCEAKRDALGRPVGFSSSLALLICCTRWSPLLAGTRSPDACSNRQHSQLGVADLHPGDRRRRSPRAMNARAGRRRAEQLEYDVAGPLGERSTFGHWAIRTHLHADLDAQTTCQRWTEPPMDRISARRPWIAPVRVPPHSPASRGQPCLRIRRIWV